MIASVKRLWAAAPIATLVLALALAAAGLFAVRGVAFWVYWSNPARHEQAIEPWMTPGYIAHSWRVPREVMVKALAMPVPPPNGPINLEDLADMRGVRVETLIAEAEAAIAAWRAANPGPDGGGR
mgnify:CR=1 FL=1